MGLACIAYNDVDDGLERSHLCSYRFLLTARAKIKCPIRDFRYRNITGEQ